MRFPDWNQTDKIGWEAQKKLAPSSRDNVLDPKDIEDLNPKKAAVLCLAYPKEESWYFPLIKRTKYPGVHSGQISFPGGRFEKEDRTYLETAIRETEEELGIELNQNMPFLELTELYIPPSNFLVFPYFSKVDRAPDFNKEDAEVDKILPIAFQELENATILYETRNHVQIPYFEFHGEKVWGATAMILNEVKEIIF